jgi:chromosome segregation ATPase
MTEEKGKIDQVLDELRSMRTDFGELKTDFGVLKTDVGQIKIKQQEDGIKLEQLGKKQQEDGIKLDQLGSDIKAVAEGHSTIRSEMKQGFEGVSKQIGFVDAKVDFLGKKVDGIDRKTDRIDNTLNATAQASYGLLSDVQKDVKEVKDTLNKHVCLPVHA